MRRVAMKRSTLMGISLLCSSNSYLQLIVKSGAMVVEKFTVNGDDINGGGDQDGGYRGRKKKDKEGEREFLRMRANENQETGARERWEGRKRGQQIHGFLLGNDHGKGKVARYCLVDEDIELEEAGGIDDGTYPIIDVADEDDDNINEDDLSDLSFIYCFLYAEDVDAGGDASPSTAMLSELSQSLQITIVGGSIPERSGDRLYNTCCVFGTDGKLMEKHRKIHLFDIDIPGQMTFKESLTLTAGESPTIVDTGLVCFPFTSYRDQRDMD
ncbi:hypothetical protein TEA_001020 [Camellia sinensis var. sinensis]|uniref:CN hydrolase domain-containing protein n=1 Tax=Camellia sinensis var. sinensis TaxID=542762 RepID=A0A4S4E8E9_CAMSN|nr:hypothetical protein TEA_001020 [Camellia sinensis var. sinensis]